MIKSAPKSRLLSSRLLIVTVSVSSDLQPPYSLLTFASFVATSTSFSSEQVDSIGTEEDFGDELLDFDDDEAQPASVEKPETLARPSSTSSKRTHDESELEDEEQYPPPSSPGKHIAILSSSCYLTDPVSRF